MGFRNLSQSERDDHMPFLRLALRRVGARQGLGFRQRRALAKAALRDHQDVLEAAIITAEEEGEEMPTRPPRDWAGFLDALASFLERILPLIVKMIEQLLPLFGGIAAKIEDAVVDAAADLSREADAPAGPRAPHLTLVTPDGTMLHLPVFN